MQDNIITLTDDNGMNTDFEFLDMITYRNENYVVLLPCDDEDDGSMVLILRIDDLGLDTESYSSVDDEKILETVFGIFKERNKDTFDFED